MNVTQLLCIHIYFSPSSEVGRLGLVFLIATRHVVRRVGKLDGVGDLLGAFFIEHLVGVDGDAKFVDIGDVIGFEDHCVKIDGIPAFLNCSCVQLGLNHLAHIVDVHSAFGVFNVVVLFLCPAFEHISRPKLARARVVDVDIQLASIELILGTTHRSNLGAVCFVEIH